MTRPAIARAFVSDTNGLALESEIVDVGRGLGRAPTSTPPVAPATLAAAS